MHLHERTTADHASWLDDVEAQIAARVLASVGDDPFFVGSALVAYQHIAGADVAGVAAFLDCPVATLPRVALFRRPDCSGPRFMEQCARIAARTGAREGRLAAILQFWRR